ncbi:MAG: hypothetical protein JKY22_00050, partial [Flavobacteriaceae bacterium]|nr:hypothetical protein [Flavobacteriaceae bacterium]
MILVLGLSFACQNENDTVEDAIHLDETIDTIIPIEIDSLMEESIPIAFESAIPDWKTSAPYHHFIESSLDTFFIGLSREIKDPFEYFRESRSNVFVMIDSGRYINDSGIWLQGENVIVKGEEGVSLLIDVLYDNVMWVSGNNIVVDNLHMMHLMPGEAEGQNCSGRVVGFDIADNVTIVNCDLNGCGLAGLHDNVGNGT